MAAINSTMVPLGTRAPYFELPGSDGKHYTLNQFEHSKVLVVIFMCNHCPYVKHVRNRLVDIIRQYQNKGVAVVAINSNDAIAYPDDSLEKMSIDTQAYGYTFPYLFDETQKIAHAFHAACTPDFFIFDAQRALVYRGQMDDSRPGNSIPVTGKDLTDALDALIENRAVSPIQKPSIGCSIKWKKGNEPH